MMKKFFSVFVTGFILVFFLGLMATANGLSDMGTVTPSPEVVCRNLGQPIDNRSGRVSIVGEITQEGVKLFQGGEPSFPLEVDDSAFGLTVAEFSPELKKACFVRGFDNK